MSYKERENTKLYVFKKPKCKMRSALVFIINVALSRFSRKYTDFVIRKIVQLVQRLVNLLQNNVRTENLMLLH